jgi:hypothetical protein
MVFLRAISVESYKFNFFTCSTLCKFFIATVKKMPFSLPHVNNGTVSHENTILMFLTVENWNIIYLLPSFTDLVWKEIVCLFDSYVLYSQACG